MKKEKDYVRMAKSYRAAVEKYIEETQGKVPNEYRIALDMLETNVMWYYKSRDAAYEHGIVYEDKNGKQWVQAIYRVMRDSESAVMDNLKQFGLTTMSRSKIKLQENGQTAEQLLEALMD